MNTQILGIALLVSGLGVGSADATWMRAADVPGMVEASDLIVVGRATRIHSQQSSLNGAESFVLLVDRVLKGVQTSRVDVQLDLSDPAYSAVSEQQYGMFFLHQATADSMYVLTDPYHPALGASLLRTANAPVAVDDPLSSVATELARVLTTPAPQLLNTLPITNQSQEVSDLYVYEETAEALQTIPYATAGAALRVIADSEQLPARLWAINCLFSIDKSEDLETLESYYLESLEPILRDPDPRLAVTISLLLHSIQVNVRSPKTVPLLTALLDSSGAEVRRAAASVLSDIATEDVIAPLAELALNDQDQDVRYYAVLGLAKATGMGYAPAVDLFEENEPKYVEFWRRWASASRE